MKHLTSRLIVLGSLAVALSANAVVINRDFDIAFSTGPLNGQSYAGSLSYDDVNLTGVGSEVMSPSGAGSHVSGFLSFAVTVDGTAFTLANDIGYPDSPTLGFQNGVLTWINYYADVGGYALAMDGVFPTLVSHIPTGVTLTDVSPTVPTDTSIGIITLREPSTGVPDGGSTLLLLGVAMAGLGAVRRARLGA